MSCEPIYFRVGLASVGFKPCKYVVSCQIETLQVERVGCGEVGKNEKRKKQQFGRWMSKIHNKFRGSKSYEKGSGRVRLWQGEHLDQTGFTKIDGPWTGPVEAYQVQVRPGSQFLDVKLSIWTGWNHIRPILQKLVDLGLDLLMLTRSRSRSRSNPWYEGPTAHPQIAEYEILMKKKLKLLLLFLNMRPSKG